MPPDYCTFKNHNDFYRNTSSDQLAYNVSEFINFALLNVGAFNNVNLNSSGAYGGSQSRLRAVDDPNYNNNQVYETFRSNWVYESGINYTYYNPITISGIYINGSFYPNGTVGANSFNLNYPLGRVVFDNAVNANIALEYSYKYVNVSTSDVPWFRQIQQNSLRLDNQQYLQKSSGDWNILSQSRVQLPAIVIDPTNRIKLIPYELGNPGLIRIQDIICYVIAETPWDRNKLIDMLVDQKDKTIYFYDINKVNESGVYTVSNYNGSINVNGLQYPDLLSESLPYRNRSCVFEDCIAQDVKNLSNLYFGAVRITCKLFPSTK